MEAKLIPLQRHGPVKGIKRMVFPLICAVFDMLRLNIWIIILIT